MKIVMNRTLAINAGTTAPVWTAPTPIMAAPTATYPGIRPAIYARHEGN